MHMLIVEFELTHNHITRTSQDESGRFGIDLTFDLHLTSDSCVSPVKIAVNVPLGPGFTLRGIKYLNLEKYYAN